MRWWLTVLVPVLVIAFVIFIVPRHRRDRHLAAVAIWTNDRLAVEPLPYAREDIEALSRIADLKFLGSLGMQHEASFGNLETQLAKEVGRHDDLLALYLAAHGMTDGDQAFIACSDFVPVSDRGRYPIRDLVHQLAACPAKLKLLILDAGRLGYEPRLGMVANEFPRIVERELAALPEQEFWVILSAGSLERSAVAHPKRQTLFGRSIAEGLHGAANRDPLDRYVTLYELYTYVHDECSRWFGGDSPARHRPLLLKAGLGVVLPTREGQGGKTHRLVWVGKPSAESESVPDGSAGSDADNPPQPPETDGSGAQTAEDAAVDGTADRAETVPSGTGPPLLAILNDVWLLRDELQESQAVPWRSPIHFAPHVWREVNALVLSYEQQVRAGAQGGRPSQPADGPTDDSTATDSESLLRDLEAIGADLRLLRSRWYDQIGEASRLSSDPIRRLDRLWQQAAKQEKPKTPASLPEVLRVREAAYGTNRMIFHAVDYVRWHAVASMVTHETLPLFADLCKYLEELAQFQNRLDFLQQYPLDSDDPSLLTGALQQYDDLVAMRDRLDQMFQARSADALSNLAQSASQLHIENDLQTPLLPGGRRGSLLRGLLEAPEIVSASRWSPDVGSGPGIAADRRRGQRVLERLMAERLLIGLVDSKEASALEIYIEPLRTALNAPSWDENAFWAECRKLGSILRAFYAGLPSRAEYRTLHLVDPRDASRVAASPPGFRYDLQVRVRPQIRLSGPQQQPLRGSQPQTVTLELSSNQRELLDLVPGVRYDRRLLDVATDPQVGPIRSEAGWFRKPLTWQVTARMNQEQAGASETPLSLSVQWSDGSGQQQVVHDVMLALPQPNRVDLLVRRAGSAGPRADDGGNLLLDLYPNRKTAYQFALVNRSGVERQVEVALYAVPQRFSGRAAPGSLDNTMRRSVLDTATGIIDADVIARTATVVFLSADPQQPTPITLAHPAAASPAPAAKPEADEPAAAPVPPPAFEAADISQGMLCVIRDVQPEDAVWYKWIGWKAIEPRRFLEAEVGYDYQRSGIRVRIQGKDFDGDGQTDLPRGAPVEVRWLDTLQQIPAGASKRLEGELDEAQGVLELFAAVPADDRKRLVTLTADGYPRGLVYEVACLETPPVGSDFRPGSDVRRTDRRVRINRLVAPRFSSEFHFAPYVHWPLTPPVAADGQAAPPVPVRIAPGEFAVVAAPCRELRVDFEIDAPVDAFRDPDHRIEVRMGDNLSPDLTFFDERSTSARLVHVGDRGLLQFETTVGDYSVSLDPGAIQNVRTFVRLQLRLPGIGDAEDRVRIVLDSEPPVVQQLQILSKRTGQVLPKRQSFHQAMRAEPLSARIEARDLSGIEVIEYEFVDPNTGQKTIQKPTLHRLQRRSASDGRHVIDLPLDTKDLALDRYHLLVRAHDLAGHDSPVASADIEFVAATPATVKGVIRGVVRFGTRHNSVRSGAVQVTVEGPDRRRRNVPVAADGSFLLTDLDPGVYHFSARGTITNRIVTGALEDVQPLPPGEAKPVTLIVDYQR